MPQVEQPNSRSSHACHQTSCFLLRSSTTAEGSSIYAERSVLTLLQVVIMHNAQPSDTPSVKGHLFRSCILLICCVGCAHSSPASDGKQLHINLPQPRCHNPWPVCGVCCKCANTYSLALAASALLQFSGNITNFATVSSSNSFEGWSAASAPCTGWTGVLCDSANQVISLYDPYFLLTQDIRVNQAHLESAVLVICILQILHCRTLAHIALHTCGVCCTATHLGSM